MSQQITAGSASTQVTRVMVARAHCELAGGTQRRFPVTQLALDGAFMVAMLPPTVGTEMTVVFYPEGHELLPPIKARVSYAVVDANSPERSGFGVTYTEFDRNFFAQLAAASKALELLGAWSDAREPKAERRRHPRIPINLEMVARLDSGAELQVRAVDLSISGALIECESTGSALELSSGTQIQLEVQPGGPDPALVLQAVVVRHCGEHEPGSFAVHFIDLDEALALQVETIAIEGLFREATA